MCLDVFYFLVGVICAISNKNYPPIGEGGTPYVVYGEFF